MLTKQTLFHLSLQLNTSLTEVSLLSNLPLDLDSPEPTRCSSSNSTNVSLLEISKEQLVLLVVHLELSYVTRKLSTNSKLFLTHLEPLPQ
jgi:hypothetical protein